MNERAVERELWAAVRELCDRARARERESLTVNLSLAGRLGQYCPNILAALSITMYSLRQAILLQLRSGEYGARGSMI